MACHDDETAVSTACLVCTPPCLQYICSHHDTGSLMLVSSEEQ